MVTRTTTYDYEQSSESGRERMVPVPWTRLNDVTPTLADPAMVTGLPVGTQITGTVINPGVAVTDPVVVLNTSPGAVFRHNVRNVITWNVAVELAWRAMNIGDVVYYDYTSDATNGVKLSTSPLNQAGTANPIFGNIVLMQDETSASYPKGTAIGGSTHVCAVMQA